MINLRQQKLIEEIVKKVTKRFPDVTYDGIWDKGDGSLGVKFITPRDNGWEISEFCSPITMRILEEEGYDIFVMPLERIKEESVR